jgi:hypothetical protein
MYGRFGSGMMRDLMDTLPHHTSLSWVSIKSFDQTESDMPQALSDLARNTALLPPSPTLVFFELTCWRASVLPLGCGEHLFAGPPRPSLKVLQLGALTAVGRSDDLSFQHAYFNDVTHGGIETPVPCFGVGDVERFVRVLVLVMLSAWCAAALVLSGCGCLGWCRLVLMWVGCCS